MPEGSDWSKVTVMNEEGLIVRSRLYSLPPDQALVNACMQDRGDFNWWDYPSPSDLGVTPSKDVAKGVTFHDTNTRLSYVAAPAED